MPYSSGIDCQGFNNNIRKGTYPCGHKASYNLKYLKEPIFCFSHAKEYNKDKENELRMVNLIRGGYCRYQDCTDNISKKGCKYCRDHDFDNHDLNDDEYSKSSKECKYQDCKNIPNFNYKGKPVKYCEDHAKERCPDGVGTLKTQMMNVNKIVCEADIDELTTCHHTALYGEAKRTHCSKHYDSNTMIKLSKDRQCDIKNENGKNICKKVPSFGYIIEEKKVFLRCKDHIEDDMQFLYQECIMDDCIKRARYKNRNTSGSRFCYDHRSDEMITDSKKICKEEKCKEYAGYNYKYEKGGLYCKDHKKDNMCSKKNIICQIEECLTEAYFNFKKGELKRFCKNHCEFGMKNNKGKKCENCEIIEVNHGNILCAECNPEGIKRIGEFAVKNFLITNNIEFEYNKQIQLKDKNDTSYFPDFVLRFNSIIIVIEVDEKQHKRYNKENEIKRMNEIYNSFKDQKVAIIRFNPDDYKINEIEYETELNKRLVKLLSFIYEISNYPDDDIKQLYYMYYNCKCITECCSIHRHKIILE